jgi:hypothetical protein
LCERRRGRRRGDCHDATTLDIENRNVAALEAARPIFKLLFSDWRKAARLKP